MIEVTGNLWTYPANVRVITTNGSVHKDGKAVMGRGCAKEAIVTWPYLPKELGNRLRFKGGNHVHGLGIYAFEEDEFYLLSFPVKHLWMQLADMDLIHRSVLELIDFIKGSRGYYGRDTVIVMPRPGCGNGGLLWEDVKPLLNVLDDRFKVITWNVGAAENLRQ